MSQRHTTHSRNFSEGFISIDCGLQGPNHTIEASGLYLVSDAGYIDSGGSKPVSSEYLIDDKTLPQYKTVRYFPEGSRNCYTLRPAQGKDGRYLIRATFRYGNYDGKNQPPKFDVYIGLQYWRTITIEAAKTIYRPEIIHTPLSDYINVCLVKTNTGIPFITVLELRTLPATLYLTNEPRGSLSLEYRINFNGSEDTSLRFKDDIYDRFWVASTLPNMTPLSTTSPVAVGNSYKPPLRVMSTALTPNAKGDGRLSFNWYTNNINDVQYMYLYFAELEVLGANQSRIFDIFLNGELWKENVTPYLLETEAVHKDQNPFSGNTSYEVELVKTPHSTLFPLINAAEIYKLIEFITLQETHDGDVAAMLNIKFIYKITQNWQGDPCGPQGFEWIGVNCIANNDSDNPRITSLNLSSQKLAGPIAAAIFELKALKQLDLSDNNLSGLVPEFLAELPLTVLNLKGNNFSQPFPQQLLSKAKSGNLKLDYDDNSGNEGGSDICQHESCGKKKKSIVVPVVASLGGILFVICASLLFFFTKSQKPKVNEHKIVASKSRQFTYDEVLQITNNFQRVIGKGGFGTVYHGYVGDIQVAVKMLSLSSSQGYKEFHAERVIGKGGFGSVYHGYVGDIQVAVKMLSLSSSQGYKEFHAEANLLITIHHKNLTSLVGYCYEGSNMGILYEYMANGSLEKHLLGKDPYVLTWEERLRMATDAAQGLEYLHHGCKPAVVHRDVKITNILVDEKFQAKLADFGLSRAFSIEDGTHVSTAVVGTPGYLDPEYYTTTRLTEKSDVYSFGIVLLEIVTGRPALLPINNEMTHIITWVSSELETGDLGNIVDPKMRGDYVVNSIWKVLEVAMSCVARNSTRRPTMNFVVNELKECLAMEINRNETESKDSIGTISSNMDNGLNPQAR